MRIDYDSIEYSGSKDKGKLQYDGEHELLTAATHLIETFLEQGCKRINVHAPSYEDVVRFLKTQFPQCKFAIYGVMDIITPVVRSRKPAYKFGDFSPKVDFGIVWCGVNGDNMHMLAYRVHGLYRTPSYTHKDEVAASTSKLGYLLEMAETLHKDGLNNLAIFVPSYKGSYKVLIEQVATRLAVNIAVFPQVSLLEELKSL